MPEEKKVRGVFEHPKGSKIYWIQYFERGKRHRERVGAKSHAIALYQRRRTQILLGEKLPELQRRKVTFGELLDDALDYAHDHGRELRNYSGKAELLRAAFGLRQAESIQPDEFAAWIRKRGVSPASFNRYRSFLSLCYREGERIGKVRENPARKLLLKAESRGRQRFLTRDEYAAVLERIRTQPFQAKYGIAVRQAEERRRMRAAGFVVSVLTGMRLNEQYGLRWRHVDFDRGEIHLSHTKNGEDRTVPMNSTVRAELEQLRPEKWKANGLVFPRLRGGSGSVAMRWFGKVLVGMEPPIEGYTWHNNRHTFCSWLAIAGCSLRTIQELAGHKDISMSARYSHLSPDHKRSEVERLVAPTVASSPGKVLPMRQVS